MAHCRILRVVYTHPAIWRQDHGAVALAAIEKGICRRMAVCERPSAFGAIKGDGLVAHLLADQLRRATVLLSEQEWKGIAQETPPMVNTLLPDHARSSRTSRRYSGRRSIQTAPRRASGFSASSNTKPLSVIPRMTISPACIVTIGAPLRVGKSGVCASPFLIFCRASTESRIVANQERRWARICPDLPRRAQIVSIRRSNARRWRGDSCLIERAEGSDLMPVDLRPPRGCRPVRARPVPPPSGAVRPPLLGPPASTDRGSTARAGSVRGLLSCAVLYCNRHASDTGRSASPVPGRPFRVASALRTVAPSPDRRGDYRVATSLGTRSRCAWGSSGINRLQPGDFSRYSKWTVSLFSQR